MFERFLSLSSPFPPFMPSTLYQMQVRNKRSIVKLLEYVLYIFKDNKKWLFFLSSIFPQRHYLELKKDIWAAWSFAFSL